MTTRAFLIGGLAILLAGAALRTLWLTADPPTTNVDVVWHDEGAWVHNARNRVLWGTWRTDDWNPVFAVPVFTALEYLAFREAGVGTWQARTVPVASGLLAIAFLMAGLAAAANRRTALVGGGLVATNYFFVMWNRAALAESTVTAFIVVAWSCYAMAERRPRWGLLAGVAVVLAFFAKANAAFFLAAMGLETLATLAFARWPRLRARCHLEAATASQVQAAALTIAGAAVTAAVILAAFVVPHWHEYDFYNRVMSIQRKPSYDWRSVLERASWLPVAQAFFSQMWPIVASAAVAIAGIAARWRTARPAERLLVFWVLVGLLELTIHDSGTGRRYVVFIPAMAALTAILAGSDGPLLPATLSGRLSPRLLALPLLLLLGYLVFGSALRLVLVNPAAAHPYRLAVRMAAGLSVGLSAIILWRWTRVVAWLSIARAPAATATLLAGLAIGWDLVAYGQWARARTDLNYQASIHVGRLLPPGTLVQGKLSNGLALENRIRPIFIGNHFGNYDDRFRRDDVRYILTYDLPSVGYESQNGSGLITDILDHYPGHHVVATFEVRETPDPNRAALFDKFPAR